MRHRVPVLQLIAAMVSAGSAAAQNSSEQVQLATGGPRFLAVPVGARSAADGGWEDARDAEVFRRRISLDLHAVPVRVALAEVARKGGLHLTFSSAAVPLDVPISLTAPDITVGAALTTILYDANIDVLLSSNGQAALVRRSPRPMRQQSVGRISGQVADATTNEPLSDVSIRVEGTTFGAVTAATGAFRIDNVPPGTYQVSARRLGYEEARQSGVRVAGDSTSHLSLRLTTAPVTLDQTVVTATKSPVSVGDVPALTSTVNDQQIEQKGDVKLTEALTNIPGLINSASNGSFESVLLRGLPRDGNEMTTTLLLIDGVPQTNSSNSARVINVPIDDVDKIEVIRGPNSALYGRTAIGGVVNILTAEPTAQPEANFQLEGGQFDLFRAKGAASGPIEQWGGYYVSAAGGQNHGYYDQPYTFRNRDNDTYAKFTFAPDTKSHGMISVGNVVSDNGVPTSIPIVGGRLLSDLVPGISPYTNFDISTSNYHQEEFRTTFNFDRQFTDWLTGTEIFGFRRVQYKFIDDGEIVGAPFDTTAHTFTDYPFNEQVDESMYYEELRFALKPLLGRVDNTLLLGVTYDYTTGFAAGNFIFTDSTTEGMPLNYEDPVYPSRSTWQYSPFGGNQYTYGILGVYAQYMIQPVTRLILLAGGRYDDANLHNVQTFNPGRPVASSDFNAFSPKLSATFKVVMPDSTRARSGLALNLYATYSGAFLPPRTPSSLTPNDTVILTPEHIRNYEGGFKGDVDRGRLSFDGGYFHMLRDGIVVETRVGPFFIPSNAGKEKYDGVELSASSIVVPPLTLFANAAFYHNRFDHFVIESSSGDISLTGNRLPVSPDQIYNAGATCRLTHGLGFTVNVKHVGTAFLDQGNTFLMPAYTVTDASIFWSIGPALITASAHNLFDEMYFTSGDIELAQSIDPAPRRQLVLSTAFRLK